MALKCKRLACMPEIQRGTGSAGPHSSGSSWPSRRPVSYAQQRATLRMVYPPPPSTSIGTPNLARKSMQCAWPSRLRLKQPRRSPLRLSAPPHTTIAPGWYTSITWPAPPASACLLGPARPPGTH